MAKQQNPDSSVVNQSPVASFWRRVKKVRRSICIIVILVIVALVAIQIYGITKEGDRLTNITTSVCFDWPNKKFVFGIEADYDLDKDRQEIQPKPQEKTKNDKSSRLFQPYFISVARAEELNETKTVTEQRYLLTSKGKIPNVALNKPVIDLRPQVKDEKFNKKLRYWHMRYSVNTGMYPTNLTDGDHSTLAYPGSWFCDYIIDLEGLYDISEVKIVWGSFGQSTDRYKYITSWELFAQDSFSSEKDLSDNDWEPITKGGIPGQMETLFPINRKVQRFRIRAISIDEKQNKLGEWIGINEFEAYGKPVVQ